MKLEEIVKAARATDSAAFGQTKDKRAMKILRAAFQQVNSTVESTEEGDVAISGLGRFTVRNVEVEKDGVKTSRRRVIYHQRAGGKKPKKA